jgi:hypothetical protein
MAKDIKTPDDYFKNGCGRCNRYATADCSTQKWASGLATLRALCLDRRFAFYGYYVRSIRSNLYEISLRREGI